MKTFNLIWVYCVTLGFSASLFAYPLDGEEESGVRRLKGYQLVQSGSGGAKLTSGQLWRSEQIRLNLVDYRGPDFDALPQDLSIQTALRDMLSARDPSYSMVLVDFSDAKNPRWAGLRPDLIQNPGSVGKLLCMTALFHVLAEVFPDPARRAEMLRTSVTKAGDWIDREIHKVPKWNSAEQRNVFALLQPSDELRLSEWIDHAISASANGAGTMVWREAMVIRHFGEAYPVTDAARWEFFSNTPKSKLSALAQAVITEPLVAAKIDTSKLRQGSFFTHNGKMKVPGTSSIGTTRELARLLFRIEQGKLVDAWSSLQMKKFMYLTKKRYRYSYAPELAQQAIFFKSGSLYSCQNDSPIKCGKYMGNKQNLMNSVAIIEGDTAATPKYIATLMSNVLGVNSAWDHSRIGAAVDKVMRTGKSQQLKESDTEATVIDAGRSD